MAAPLRLITCGSVDDGKSTLIGRLLLDSQAVLQDQLAAVQRKNVAGQSGELDLALFTDGLSAEREQGITIDVAYRYFATPKRKFIIGDAPGHEQYTRNMVTAASSADCAVVLVDALKLDWQSNNLTLLTQTRRHTLLAKLLGVPHIVFAVNKLDAVEDAALAFVHISAALEQFANQAGLYAAQRSVDTVPLSALKGWNVVNQAEAGWAGYTGPSLLSILESLDNVLGVLPSCKNEAFSMPVQWVEKNGSSADTSTGRRIYWGRLGSGQPKVGDAVRVHPTGQTAHIAKILNHVRAEIGNDSANDGGSPALNGEASTPSRGIVLDRELDVSRGDYLLAQKGENPPVPLKETVATLAWLDTEPLVQGRVYQLFHGHRWVKAKLASVEHCLNIHTLEPESAHELTANSIGSVRLQLQEALPILPYSQSKRLGSAILVDPANNRTSAAVLF